MITVMDVNDNAPQFTSHLYNGSIEEDSLPSVTVMIVSDYYIDSHKYTYLYCVATSN